MKTYVGIARDHSGSMQTISKQAKEDYNNLIDQLTSASKEEGVDTIVNTVTFGFQSKVTREVINSSVNAVRELTEYRTDSQTPLFDAVGELITMLSSVPDVNEKDVNFLVMVITDGQENASRKWSAQSLTKEIQLRQGTDRWTFTFRVPDGYARELANMGIPAGNIIEWEQTERGMKESTVKTKAAVKQFYQQSKAGQTRSTAFYADLSNVKLKDIRENLEDISAKVSIWPVKTGGSQIKEFIENKTKKTMQLGTAFYQLSKPEKEVQDYKLIVIRNRHSGKVYGGREAREMIGLPTTGTIKLAPGDHGNFDVFIQSTSTNRKLIAGTEVLFWPQARSV